MTSISRCPRCESREVVPCDALLEASDETLRANYECAKCHTRFRYTPGTYVGPALAIEAAAGMVTAIRSLLEQVNP